MRERHPLIQPSRDTAPPVTYEIRVEGHLSPQWSAWFEGMEISLEAGGVTALTGPVVDQAQLFGIIKSVRDLNLPLVSVRRLTSGLWPAGKRKR